MKKIVKSGLIVGLCAMLVLPTFACSASEYDNETRKFSMAIGAIDGNFNPFFYTAANDGTVVSMTQASMLATDANGNIVCGEDYPTVVKDYTVTSYNSNGQEVNSDSATSDNTEYTTYSFLIKNGMKFSDGEDLTIMDVLFSLYVNIDMAYTGSATLYSNDIQGLNAYREQDATLTDDSTSSGSSYFTAQGQQRITNIVNYCGGSIASTDQILADIETVKELFYDELTSDWTDVEDSFGSRDEDTYEYNFTETWQAYLLQEGVISVATTTNSNGATVQVKDANGKYVTTLDEGEYYSAGTWPDDIAAVKADESLIAAYTNQGYSRENAIEYVVRDYCINEVWESFTGGYTADGGVTNKSKIAEIVQYWATASEALEKFAGEARTEYYEELKANNGGSLVVQTISGVTTSRVTAFDGEQLDGTYDVLTITINGVDPKAIWNFAFSVCPLHYYSGTWGGKNYVQAAQNDYAAYVENWDNGDKTYQLTEFGVECGNSDFFDDVLNDTSKNRLPVGAGPYAASNSSGTEGTSATFYANKYVYYMRNEYFYTMGEGINNAKIKYIVYSEMSDNTVLSALLEQEVDYGTPSATVQNQSQLSSASSYLDASTLYYTNGYGYVGINPKFVPDVTVRQVLMMSMNTSLIVKNYYTTTYSDTIYRPMSKTSWAYPTGCTAYYDYTTSVSTIENMMESAGYYKNSDGIYTNGTTTCKFTFTIAGDTTDHPAYDMFCDAEEFLEQCGFDITVKTDSTALNKLATGNLEVWAAAWSSAIDPDMYQVYHKDSTASSVKNWNYTEILQNPSDWQYEYDIIQELSDVIDDARETNNQSNRAALYSDALDLVMELAVELPTYQRMDNEVYNKNVIKASSLSSNPTCYSSLIDRIWEIEYN
ncbi:MAG: ABC transporter substrate-binding protein [Clostridia bacterium]|nr:ABC transporter substrate-binding protein [Clostridia bacterium]